MAFKESELEELKLRLLDEAKSEGNPDKFQILLDIVSSVNALLRFVSPWDVDDDDPVAGLELPISVQGLSREERIKVLRREVSEPVKQFFVTVLAGWPKERFEEFRKEVMDRHGYDIQDLIEAFSVDDKPWEVISGGKD